MHVTCGEWQCSSRQVWPRANLDRHIMLCGDGHVDEAAVAKCCCCVIRAKTSKSAASSRHWLHPISRFGGICMHASAPKGQRMLACSTAGDGECWQQPWLLAFLTAQPAVLLHASELRQQRWTPAGFSSVTPCCTAHTALRWPQACMIHAICSMWMRFEAPKRPSENSPAGIW